MGESGRVDFIDVGKGVGILLVVFGHVWRGLHGAGIVSDSSFYVSIDNAVYLFHMPLFFILSGMVFERPALRQNIREFITGRVESIIYPLLIWSYITAVFIFMAGGLTNRPSITIVSVILYPFPPKDIYWFLAALFVAQVIAWFVVRLRNRLFYVLACLIAFLPVYGIDLHDKSAWVRSTIENVPYFFLGMAVAEMNLNRLAAVALGTLAFACSEYWAVAQLQPLQSPSDTLPGLAASLGVLVSVAWLTPRAPRSLFNVVVFLGRGSMTIYVSHIIALAAARIALQKLGFTSLALHLVFGVGCGVGFPVLLYIVASNYGVMRVLGLGKDIPRVPQGRKFS